MRRCTRLFLAGLTAAGAMSAAVGTAHANDISVAEPSFRIVWESLTMVEAFYQVTCSLTLEGTTGDEIEKWTTTLVQLVVTDAAVGTECEDDVWVTDLFWNATYTSFTGALPNITGIYMLLRGFYIEWEPGCIFNCLIVPDFDDPLGITFARDTTTGVIDTAIFDEDRRISQDGIACGARSYVEFRGTGTVYLGGTTTPGVRMTLI